MAHPKPYRLAPLALLAMLALASPGPARAAEGIETGELGDTVTVVTVERVKPKKEKFATLRFLKENRDFIRARFDLLKQESESRAATAVEIDPRFLAYRRMIADILSAKDSVSRAEDARSRDQLLASVQDLGRVESQLDQMGRLLADQQARLATLERDFTGRQRTELAIVMSGDPSAAPPSQVVLTLDDRGALSIPITPEQAEGLRRGAIVELFHGLIEPREQEIEISVASAASRGAGWVTIEPERDRLTFLRFHVGAAGGSLRATTWRHETGLAAGEKVETAP